MRASEFIIERKKRSKKTRGYGGYFFPGYGFYGGDAGEGGGDGGGGGESKQGMSEAMAADQVLDYVKRAHAPEAFDIEYSITDHPEWELKNIPLLQLNLDPDGEEPDPYNRVNWVDDDKVQELIPQIEAVLKRMPIVVDPEGWIIDGNHRAMAAVEAGLTSVPALVPVKQDMAEGQSVKQEIKDFIDSLTPADVGVEEFPGYRVHFEGFTDECKSSSDYQKNPDKVYQQVYQDFVQREGGKKPAKSGMVGDEEYPILYSVFRVPQSKTVDTAERAYSIAYRKKQPWPRGSREEQLIRSDWQLSALYDQYVLKQGVTEGKVKLYTDPGYFGAEVDDAGFDSLPVVNISADRLVGFEPDSKMQQPKSQANVEKIVAGLKKGDKLPPLLVRKYKNGYQVLDGHHRFWAYKLSGTKSIPVRIVADKDIEEISKQGVTEGVYRGDWVRHPDNPWQIGQIQSIDNGQALVTWKKTDKRKKAMSSTHAVDALQHARREFSQLTQPTHTPGMAEDKSNDTAISLSKLGKFHPGADTLAQFVPERATAQYALHPDKWESTFYSLTNKDSDKLKYYGPKKISIPPGTLVGDMAIANKFYRAKTPEEQEQYAELYKASLQPYPVDVSEYRMPELLIPKQGVAENFADGRNPGRKGLAKRSGVNTKASVSSLRKTAKHSSGEKQRMAHWLANMKAGRAKAKK